MLRKGSIQYRLTTRTILKHTDGNHVNCIATFVNYGNNSTRFYACHQEYIGNGLNLLTKFILEDVMKCKLITSCYQVGKGCILTRILCLLLTLRIYLPSLSFWPLSIFRPGTLPSSLSDQSQETSGMHPVCVYVPHEKHVDSANFLQFLLTFKQIEFSHD